MSTYGQRPLAKTEKQVGETRTLAFHYELEMAPGETIITIDGVDIVPQGIVTQVAALSTNGQQIDLATKQFVNVSFTVGTDGELYELTARVTTSSGQKLFCLGLLAVVNY